MDLPDRSPSLNFAAVLGVYLTEGDLTRIIARLHACSTFFQEDGELRWQCLRQAVRLKRITIGASINPLLTASSKIEDPASR